MKKYLPIYLDVSNRKVLLVGGGNVARQKLSILSKVSCKITVVAPIIAKEIIETGVEFYQEEYTPSHLDGADIVYACTSDTSLNERIKKDASSRGILVNVVDSPEISDFVSPAVYSKKEMTVAVSSNATDVKKSIKWRNIIKDIFDNDNY